MLKAGLKNDTDSPFAVIDIETNQDGTYCLGAYYDGENYIEFDTAKNLVSYILHAPIYTVYAHCGMAFDYSLLLTQFLAQGEVEVCLAGSQGISMRFYSKEYKKRKISLLDSYRLLPASLMKLSKQFTDLPKLELDVMPWDLSPIELRKYLKRDCESLYLTISKFWQLIDTKFGCTRANTLSALSLKIYRKKYMPYDIVASNRRIYQFERDSYFGGMVHVTPGKYERVFVYDINSMYPFCMRNNKFPYSYVGRWVKTYTKGNCGLYKIRYSINTPIPFLFDIDERKMTNQGIAIVDSSTYEYACNFGSIQLIEGYEYFRTAYMFRDFVDDFYEMRMQSDAPLDFICKIILNSLYGKFGQKRESRTLTTIEPKDNIPTKIYNMSLPTEGFPQCYEIFDLTRKAIVPHSFPAIASMVTLQARQLLHSYTDNDTIYTDTDSIHSIVERSDIPLSRNLGDCKLEYEGRATYLGKKLYQLHDNNIIKAKGFPPNSMRGVDFDKLYSPTSFEYESFPSILNQAKHNRRFRLDKLNRTINP